MREILVRTSLIPIAKVPSLVRPDSEGIDMRHCFRSYLLLRACIAATALVALVPAALAGPRTYTYVDIGVLASESNTQATSNAFAVSSSRQVAGVSSTDLFGVSHAMSWLNGRRTDLGTVGRSANSSSAAYGINDAGDVVGQSNITASEPPHATLFSGGKRQDLGTLFGSGSFSRATDINNQREVVGVRAPSQASPQRAFLLRQRTFVDLGTLGGEAGAYGVSSEAWAINDLGQVVGAALPPNGALRAFLWQNGTMRDLGDLGGTSEASVARSINNYGVVAGYSQTASGATHAFLYTNGSMTDLGTLGGNSSQAYGINSLGQVVGGSRTPSSPTNNAGHAVLWDNGQIVDLNTVTINLPASVTLESA